MKGVTGRNEGQKGRLEEAGEENDETLSHLPKSFQVFSSILEKARETGEKHGNKS